jgi:hypothetical protein
MTARRRHLRSKGVAFPGGEPIFQRIYTRLGCEGRPPRFVVEYHPYANLTQTIRLKEDTAHVRLSDLMVQAPVLAVEAVAAILLGKLYRRRVPRQLIERYREFSYSPKIRRKLHAKRQTRARKIPHQPGGTHHDLAALHERLNQSYFGSELKTPRLGWSRRGWRSMLGCYDPALDQIVINRKLDQDAVPEYVVAYVMYHEMLHQKHPVRFARCRRESHSASFRAEEKQFREYAQAMKFLRRFR